MPSRILTSELHRRVRTRLAWLQITQHQAAVAMSMDPSAFSRQLKRETPSEDFLVKLALLLGWEVEAMMAPDNEEILFDTHPALETEHPTIFHWYNAAVEHAA